jgi:hypothetical protein
MDTVHCRKRLPYGNCNFESVRTENYVYIDKTQYIELLEQEPNKNLFFIRPRKFGKSLFFPRLSHYYDIKGADKFDTLFGNLYIGKHPTPLRNSYLVLNLDFSGLDTTSEDDFRKSFALNVQHSVIFFLIEHRHFIPDIHSHIKKIESESSGIGALWEACEIASLIDRKMFIIIDEYDHFANDPIAMGTPRGDDIYRNMIRANGMVRDFYETLKAGSKTVIDRIMLTGITPIMLDDLTSGFNISYNISLEEKYNEMLGFTSEEVEKLMDETGVDRSLITVDMELFYNGYLFHKDGKHRVYNPTMMLYFVMQLLESDRAPENIIDENLKTDYGRLRLLLRTEQNREQLMAITTNNSIVSDIIPKFPIDKLHDGEYFISLLFYMGLLTIDREDEGALVLKIPNYSIRTVYWEYMKRLMVDLNEDVLIDLSKLKIAIRELAFRGNPTLFIDYVSNNIFSRLSNRDLRDFNEKYIKIMLLDGLFQSKLYIPITETEVTQGYTDIWLKRSHRFPEIPYEWVWEVKYVKKSDAENAAVIRSVRENALAQLQKYRSSHLFAGRTDVRYLSLIFIGKDTYELEELK